VTNQLRQPLLVLVLICAAFTCVASAVVLTLALTGHVESDTSFLTKLVIRIAGFAGLAVIVMLALLRGCTRESPLLSKENPNPRWHLVFIPCVIAAAIAFPRLGATPHVEPDEWHHLDVARNLAVHGLYASGNPDDGFVLFDSYDSVGPPVILPIAAAMYLTGPHLESARLLMAVYFVALAGVVFAYCAPVFGGWAAMASSLLVIGALGSAYLGRALYGEVPALLFFILALIAGRAALRNRHVWVWGITAGAMFGLAILSKYYLLMAVWPLLGTFVFDRLTTKRIRWHHVAAPAIGMIAIIGSWSTVQAFAEQNVSKTAGGQLSVYQHNLLFGVEGLKNTTGHLAKHPASAVALIVGFAFGLWFIQRHTTDPTVVAVWLFAGFQWYWWLFFNTGNLPRYSWYGWATTAMFLGPLLITMTNSLIQKTTNEPLSRPLAVACCAAIVVPAAIRTTLETKRAWQDDEMQYTRDLATYVANRPADDRIATMFWPLERSIQFLSGRTIARFRETDTADEYDVVLVKNTPTRESHGPNIKRFGPYSAITSRN